MAIKHLFDESTNTLTYIVHDETSRDAVIIDPVLDFDFASGRVSQQAITRLKHYVNEQGLQVKMLLETHAHADHFSSAQFLKKDFPGTVTGIGAGIKKVQQTFKDLFNLQADFPVDGSQFDHLFNDGEKVTAGSLSFTVITTPGHTPACCSFLFDEGLFTGDALMMPDFGTGRCDFPGGSAADLYHSIHEKLYALPDDTKVYVGHDYMPGGRELAFESSIGEQKAKNTHLTQGCSSQDFINFREGRDAKLNAPKLLMPSIQINIDAGHLPATEANGTAYLKIPIMMDDA